MLEVLRRVIQEVNAARDLDTALDIIVDRIQSAMATQVCSVYLLDDETNQYVFRATRGLNQEILGKVTFGTDESLVGLVAERAEPVNVNNAPKHPRYRYIDNLGEDEYHSFLGVPIIHHRKVLGVIVVQRQSIRRYDE
ncbi:MAG: phosphotransferase system enzyme I (PtsP), partial [Flavobacterium sp.]